MHPVLTGILLTALLGWVMALGAAELQISPGHPAIRPGLLFRSAVHAPHAGQELGSGVLVVEMAQAGRVLDVREFPFADGAALAAGVRVNWVAPAELGTPPVQITATFLRADGGVPLRVESSLPTVPGLLQRAAAHIERVEALRPGFGAMQHLRLEQAGLLAREPLALDELAQLGQVVAGLEDTGPGLTDPRDGLAERAWIDPVDGSVQPYRLRLPDRAPRALVVFLGEYSEAVNKAVWPLPDSGDVQAISAAGAALVQVYPAGDRSWQGLGRQRVPRLLRELAVTHRLQQLPLLLWGRGVGAFAAVDLATEYPGFAAGILHDQPVLPPALTPALGLASHWWQAKGPLSRLPRLDLPVMARRGGLPRTLSAVFDDSQGSIASFTGWDALVDGLIGEQPLASWLDAPQVPAVEAPDVQPGRLAAYADRPFVVVVGSGEHRAAAEANQRLADAFRGAWAGHAQGLPPLVRDTAFIPEDWQQHNLVLVGNPRSNAVAASLWRNKPQPLPLNWDHRTLTFDGGDYLRATAIGVAVAWEPAEGSDQVIVLMDGQPCWLPGTLPLLACGDVALRGADGRIRGWLFDSDWRLLRPAQDPALPRKP